MTMTMAFYFSFPTLFYLLTLMTFSLSAVHHCCLFATSFLAFLPSYFSSSLVFRPPIILILIFCISWPKNHSLLPQGPFLPLPSFCRTCSKHTFCRSSLTVRVERKCDSWGGTSKKTSNRNCLPSHPSPFQPRAKVILSAKIGRNGANSPLHEESSFAHSHLPIDFMSTSLTTGFHLLLVVRPPVATPGGIPVIILD